MASFNEPGQGIHSVRIFDVAIVDVILTILVSLMISTDKFITVFAIFIILSIIIHTILRIKTRTNAWLFK